MNDQLIIIAVGAAAALALGVGAGWLIKQRHHLDRAYFTKRWQALLKLCADESTWLKAIVEADILLDEALKRCSFKGQNTGQRLANATRSISNPDLIWQAHKLRNRLTHESGVKLSKKIVIRALEGYRGALKDLGAL